jgi:hypothetical protein
MESFVLHSTVGSDPLNESFTSIEAALDEAISAFKNSRKTPIYIRQGNKVIFDYIQLLQKFHSTRMFP